MQLFNECTNRKCEIEKTTSWSGGLNEASQFLPCLSRPVRRTNSIDDIQMYKDYFLIAQKNQGQDFTWKKYSEILLDTLRNFDTTALMSKIPSRSFIAPIKSETSNDTTVIGSEPGKRKYLGDFIGSDDGSDVIGSEPGKRKYLKDFIGSDDGSDVIGSEPGKRQYLGDKVSSGEIMQLFNECTNEKCEIEKTTSWSGGLNEASQFLPCLSRTVRRTNSVDDIQMYKEYFLIAQKNQGQDFTWKKYTKILLDTLRDFDTTALMSKLPVQDLNIPPVEPKTANFTTVIGSESSKREYLENNNHKRIPFSDHDKATEKVSSANDVKDVILTPSKYSTKEMCSEFRILAQKTCKSVGILATLFIKYSFQLFVLLLSVCGKMVYSVAIPKKDSKQHLEKILLKEPLTQTMLKASNIIAIQPTCSRTPVRTVVEPSGTCVIHIPRSYDLHLIQDIE